MQQHIWVRLQAKENVFVFFDCDENT